MTESRFAFFNARCIVLKVSPKSWYNELTGTSVNFEFESCVDDVALWINQKHNIHMIMQADCMQIACKDLGVLTACKKAHIGAFMDRDLGPTDRFLNASITADKHSGTVELNQLPTCCMSST